MTTTDSSCTQATTPQPSPPPSPRPDTPEAPSEAPSSKIRFSVHRFTSDTRLDSKLTPCSVHSDDNLAATALEIIPSRRRSVSKVAGKRKKGGNMRTSLVSAFQRQLSSLITVSRPFLWPPGLLLWLCSTLVCTGHRSHHFPLREVHSPERR